MVVPDDVLPAPHQGGARSLLLTMLGEFVLPHGGAVWTSTILAGLATVDITERNARQAAARLGDQGIVAPERIGRRTRWHLTDAGTRLLSSGTERIYSFGRRADDWEGTWLLVMCAVPESQRAVRNQLRTQLTFEGFGFLSPTIAISPHADREKSADDIIDALGLGDSAMTFVARSGEITDDTVILATAWDLDDLTRRYAAFIERFASAPSGRDQETAFGDTLLLVDSWRRFPFADPELPTELLPDSWVGWRAHDVFDGQRAARSTRAIAWYRSAEAGAT